MTGNALIADKLARAIIKRFDEPIEGDAEYEEIRGWYHFDGDTRYIARDPKTGIWTSRTDDCIGFLLSHGHEPPQHLPAKVAWEALALPAHDASEVLEKMAMLHYLPAPPLPMETDRPAQTEPFVHDGWLFAWYFFPEIKRWVLAPVGRR